MPLQDRMALSDIERLNPQDPQFAVQVVERLLAAGREARASDLHLQPTPDGLEVRWRIDGVLHPVATFPPQLSPNIVGRLKVLAELLTYRSELPQEGRIRSGGVEMRVSTFPTLYGEKAVVRLFATSGHFDSLADLRLPPEITAALERLLAETSGAVLVTGPAGSGKTTTLYACLRHLAAASRGGRSIATLEDPIEAAVPGVSQSQVQPAAGFDLATGLRFLMRQDPEVIMVGEMRDRTTAELALQASLTGHLLLTTFHAGSAAAAISRLSDMGIEPYLLRSGLLAILSQRLVRRLCDCATWSDRVEDRLGLNVERVKVQVGCSACNQTGYRGRMVLAEMLLADQSDLGRAILSRDDAATLQRLAVQGGMITRWQRGVAAVAEGQTSPMEVRRVFGFSGHTTGNEE
jgi:type II secretory ATPase GspE/PulE/Tfp pilus assembly ATPase PilB-like protein